VVRACQTHDGLDFLADSDLHAPALMWSEARYVIREALWREEISTQQADTARHALDACPVKAHTGPELSEHAWTLSVEFGWAKTYDAEYVALAQILRCRLVTLDMRLRRGTDRLGFVITPDELQSPHKDPSKPAADLVRAHAPDAGHGGPAPTHLGFPTKARGCAQNILLNVPLRYELRRSSFMVAARAFERCPRRYNLGHDRQGARYQAGPVDARRRRSPAGS
jgi:predicted nucleic acid-binding protein